MGQITPRNPFICLRSLYALFRQVLRVVISNLNGSVQPRARKRGVLETQILECEERSEFVQACRRGLANHGDVDSFRCYWSNRRPA